MGACLPCGPWAAQAPEPWVPCLAAVAQLEARPGTARDLAVGGPRAMSAETHGPRRGYACDLALAGAPLSKILEQGDWRSESFRLYLESIRDQLQNRALMGILGDHSDDEGVEE